MTGNRKVLEDRPNQSSERRPSRPRKLPSSKNFHFSIIPRVFSLAQAYNISQTILFPFFGKNKNYNKIINIDWNALELRPRDWWTWRDARPSLLDNPRKLTHMTKEEGNIFLH